MMPNGNEVNLTITACTHSRNTNRTGLLSKLVESIMEVVSVVITAHEQSITYEGVTTRTISEVTSMLSSDTELSSLIRGVSYRTYRANTP